MKNYAAGNDMFHRNIAVKICAVGNDMFHSNAAMKNSITNNSSVALKRIITNSSVVATRLLPRSAEVCQGTNPVGHNSRLLMLQSTAQTNETEDSETRP